MTILIIGKNNNLIKLLNNYHYYEKYNEEIIYNNYNFIILVNQNNKIINKINLIAREHNIKFICLFIDKFNGLLFFDYGDVYITQESLNEVYYPIYIKKFNNDIIYCNHHNFHDNDIIKIDKEYKIKVINRKCFKLKNFNILDYPFKSEYCFYIKKKITVNHKKYSDIYIHENDKSVIDEESPFLTLFNNIIITVIKGIHIPIKQIFKLSENIEITNKKIYLSSNNYQETLKLLNFEDIKSIDEKDAYVISICNNKINEICFNKDIPLFECYKNNYIGHIQSIIPYKTEISLNYDNEITYPICVITHFPNETPHVIEWSKEKYKELIPFINTFSDIKITIEKALEIFINNYYINIMQLLHIHNSDDSFWSDDKKCPIPIEFDINNKIHLNYIFYTVNILMSKHINEEIIINELEQMTEFINSKKLIKISDDTIEYKYDNYTSSNIIINSDWLYYSNMLRSINYNIPYIHSIEINDNILNNILISISMLEIYNLNNPSNIGINLIDLTFIKYEPLQPQFINYNGKLLNSWTKFEYKKNSSILEFKKYYELLLNINITMICCNSKIIYAEFIENDVIDLSEYNNKIITCISDDDNIEIPLIKISF